MSISSIYQSISCYTAYPNMSTIRKSWLNSEDPGKRGNPRNNSAQIHPKDHISMAELYLNPINTSGDR